MHCGAHTCSNIDNKEDNDHAHGKVASRDAHTDPSTERTLETSDETANPHAHATAYPHARASADAECTLWPRGYV